MIGGCFDLVKAPFISIGNGQQFDIMRPAQGKTLGQLENGLAGYGRQRKGSLEIRDAVSEVDADWLSEIRDTVSEMGGQEILRKIAGKTCA